MYGVKAKSLSSHDENRPPPVSIDKFIKLRGLEPDIDVEARSKSKFSSSKNLCGLHACSTSLQALSASSKAVFAYIGRKILGV